MATGKRRIRAELTMLALIVASLAGALHLVVSIHRRSLVDARRTKPDEPSIPAPVVEAAPAPSPTKVVRKPRPTTAPTRPPSIAEDPTPKVLAEIAAATDRERAETQRLDREAASLEEARKKAEAGSEGWRRREMLVKQQIAQLEQKSKKLDRDVDVYASERDVLAKERDALKAAIAKAPGEGSYAVLPYQGENGTWRRPIVLECTSGNVTIKPDGPSFSMIDLSGLAHPRSSPVVVAIARELLKVKTAGSPDGSPVVPYFVFLVRPDGIRTYYELRARLEPLGIAFGYELVEQNLDIHVPNFDDLATWDGSPSIAVPSSGLAGTPAVESGNRAVGVEASKPGEGGGLAWPGGDNGAKAVADAFKAGRGGEGSFGANAGGESPGDFVWPTSRPGLGAVGRARGDDAGVPRGDGLLGAGGSTRGNGTDSRALGGVGGLAAGGRGGAIGGDDWLRGPYGPGSGPEGRGPGDEVASDAVGNSLPDLEKLAEGSGSPVIRRPIGANEGRSDRNRAGAAGASESRKTDASSTAGALARRSGRAIGSRSSQIDAVGGPADELEPAPRPAEGPQSAQEGGLMWDGSGATAGPAVGGSNPASGDSQPASSVPKSATGGSNGGSGKPSGGAGKLGGSPPSGTLGNAPQRVPALPSLAGLGAGMGSPIGLGSPSPQPPPGLMIGADSDPGKSGSIGSSDAKGGDDPEMKPLIPKDEEKPVPAIEVPFEIVVACGADGLTIQPGGYRITKQALRGRREEELLVRNLEALALKRAQVDPAIRPRPRVKFLVEDNGAPNFWEARRQVLFSGLNWPMTLQVAGAQNPRFLEQGVW